MHRPHPSDPARPGIAARFLRALSLLALCILCLSGCGLMKAGLENGASKADAAAEKAADDGLKGTPVPYRLSIVVQGGPKDLKDKMKDASVLAAFAKKPPDSLLGLERRARTDAETAVQLLHSQCYYDGTASFSIDSSTSPVAVTLTLVPGTRYTVGRASVVWEPRPVVPEAFRHRVRSAGFFGLDERELPPPEFPTALPGVKPGEAVTADDMLAAVEALIPPLRRTGYPLAKVTEALYTLDREKRHLNADITVDPGPPARLGGLSVSGNAKVGVDYFSAMAPWNAGAEPWDDEVLDAYANSLRASGLFRTVKAAPATERIRKGPDGIAVLPVDVVVDEAPFRTVAANARYDTDTGFGVEGMWEHRNVFGNGEKLTVRAPIGTQAQGLKTSFEKPAFLDRNQRLLGHLNLMREETDAYRETGGDAFAGVERRLSKNWWGGAGLFANGGSLKESGRSEEAFLVGGPRAFIRHDSRNNQLDPTEGSECKLTVSPFVGTYREDLAAVSAKLSASLYYAPLRGEDGRPDDSVVLAAHVEGGSISGASLDNIPATMRFFAGGAGSVRGYPYQAVGPRNARDEPLGGRSYQVVNLEARLKVAKNVGIVPFVDGGMVYRDEMPQIVGDMRWGGGLGLRYYTPIGPVRLDVATPFNPIDGDPPVQVYISVGQSF
ncbi:MAG: outer membrane protein assembly factor [Desulfovibrio sp.]|nr:outer membrane protein assembly factor [Desulfovibrio sp.]